MKEERGVAVREVIIELAFEKHLRKLAEQRERRARTKTKRKGRKKKCSVKNAQFVEPT